MHLSRSLQHLDATAPNTFSSVYQTDLRHSLKKSYGSILIWCPCQERVTFGTCFAVSLHFPSLNFLSLILPAQSSTCLSYSSYHSYVWRCDRLSWKSLLLWPVYALPCYPPLMTETHSSWSGVLPRAREPLVGVINTVFVCVWQGTHTHTAGSLAGDRIQNPRANIIKTVAEASTSIFHQLLSPGKGTVLDTQTYFFLYI